MEQIIVAVITTSGLVGAAYITARMATKLKGAEARAITNTDTAEGTITRLWQVIDDLRQQNGKLQTDIEALEAKAGTNAE